MSKNQVKKVEKLAKISFTNNYGGQGYLAWLIEEFYNGQKGHSGHKVLYREDYDRLSEVCEKYVKDGFKIEISEYESPKG